MEELMDQVNDMRMMIDLIDGKDNFPDYENQVQITKSKLDKVEEALATLKREQNDKLAKQKILIERLQRLIKRLDYMKQNRPPNLEIKAPPKPAPKLEERIKNAGPPPMENIENVKPPQNNPPKSKPARIEALKTKEKDVLRTPEPKKGLEASINYVSNSDFEKVSTYMRGRLKLTDINALVDVYNNVLNKKVKLMNKKPLRSTEEVDLVQKWKEQSRHSSLHGQYFCTVDDFKTQENLKFGKKEFSIMIILRHVNKIKEVREGRLVFYVACF